MRGRCERDLDVRLDPIEQVAAPQQRVRRVVVDERVAAEHPEDGEREGAREGGEEGKFRHGDALEHPVTGSSSDVRLYR
jgi:hypothetical protein